MTETLDHGRHDPVRLILDRASNVRRDGAGWKVSCPITEAHTNGDMHPSLGVNYGADGRAVLNCRSVGCDVREIVRRFGLTMSDLFAEPLEREAASPVSPIRYDYIDEFGKPLYRVERKANKEFPQEHWNGQAWVRGLPQTVRRVPYHLPQLLYARDRGERVYIVEGEKDVHTLEYWGLVATTCSGGSGAWRRSFAQGWDEYFTGLDVVVLPDNDEPGRKYSAAVQETLQGVAASVRVCELAVEAGEDVTDWIQRRGGTKEALEALVDPPPLEPVRSSWEPLDLRPVLRGDTPDDRPTILQRIDGAALLYAGKVNTIVGEPESGKSLVAMEACRQEIEAGRIVVYIDYEDDEVGMVERLRAMGLTDDQIDDGLMYVRPDEPLQTPGAQDAVQGWLGVRPSLVVIDGLTEAFGLEGLDLESNREAAIFMNRYPKLIAQQGPAVLLIDHVVKDPDKRGRYGLGAGHKFAAVTGTQMEATVILPFGRGTSGKLRLKVTKDRKGHVRGVSSKGKQQYASEVDVESTGGGSVLQIRMGMPEQATTESGGELRPTWYMARVSECLQRAPGPMSGNQIVDSVGRKRAFVLKALEQLVQEGNVAREMGPRRSQLHTLVTPFSEEDETS